MISGGIYLEECRNVNFDVCMQDVHRLDCDSIAYLGCNLFWTGNKEKRQHGVAIAIGK